MKSTLSKCATFSFLGIALLCANSLSASTSGISDTEIVLGQSAALGGPAAALGQGMQAGLNAYFSEINEKGGINGRTIKLVSLDDGYEPDRAISNTQKLISEQNVFLLIGEVGTPTSKAVVPVAESNKVPFMGPFTGAEFLRSPFKPYVVNVRGSYNQEMERLTQYLHEQKGYTKIGIFYQNDGYGKAGLDGLQLALEKRGLTLTGSGTYERNTVAVKKGLSKLRRANPEAIVMVGAYQPCAEFIKQAKKAGMTDTTYANISFVGTKALQAALGESGEGTIISQVVPSPFDTSIPVVKEYQAMLKKHSPTAEPDWTSLEGFLVAKLFAEIAQSLGKNFTRDAFLSTIQSKGTFDLGGITLNFGPEDHQGMDEVFLTVIKDNAVIPLSS